MKARSIALILSIATFALAGGWSAAAGEANTRQEVAVHLPLIVNAYPLPPGPVYPIAFSSYRDGSVDIYVMRSDGSETVRLTDDQAKDWDPEWSPDGSKILFTSDRDDTHEYFSIYDLYVMNADGSNVTRLTNTLEIDEWFATWSPDGRQIAFERHFETTDEECTQIFIMDADGSNQKELTPCDFEYLEPAWSPDGTKIVFVSNKSGGWGDELFVMNTDGSGVTQLTNSHMGNLDPSWSPDGSKIVFSYVDPTTFCDEIGVVNADGSGYHALTSYCAENAGTPDWSIDGQKIAFDSDMNGGTAQIYVMDADGGHVRRLTFTGSNSGPAWSPVMVP